jgi:hypothetical protein
MNAKATNPNSESAEQVAGAAESISVPYWLLKEGRCKKLGKHAEGGIKYQILASDDRASLYIRITENEGGGYFSKEIVPFVQIVQCLQKCDAATPFPSKALREAFTGRSSNNAGFLAAILRKEVVLDAAKDAESQHVVAVDLDAWIGAALTPHGTKIEIAPSSTITSASSSAPAKKTLTLPQKK